MRVEPLLRGHPFESPPPPSGKTICNVNLNINGLISTPDERPPLLKGHFLCKRCGLTRGVHLYIYTLESLLLHSMLSPG